MTNSLYTTFFPKLKKQSTLENIIWHINHLLNATNANTPHLQNYGLSEQLLTIKEPETIYSLIETMKNCILNFEPRILECKIFPISDDPNEATLKFHMKITLNNYQDLLLKTTIQSDHSFIVSLEKPNE